MSKTSQNLDIMLEVRSSMVAYAVLSVGGFLGWATRCARYLECAGVGTAAKLSREHRSRTNQEEPAANEDRWPSAADLIWGMGLCADR